MTKELLLYEPFPHQQEFLDDGARIKVGDFGRQSGKTQVAGLALTKGHGGIGYDGLPKYQGLLHGKRGIWFAPTDDLTDIAWRRIKDWFKPLWPDLKKADSKNDKWLELPNGGFLKMQTGWNPELTGIGDTLDFLVIDEAARARPELWDNAQPMLAVRNTQRLTRARSGGGWAILISTPKGKNWFFREWERGQKLAVDPATFEVLRDERGVPRENPLYLPEYRSWNWPSTASPLFGQAEYDSLKARYLPTKFEREILARFVLSEGNFFKKSWFKHCPRIIGDTFLTASLPIDEESRGEPTNEDSQRHLVVATWLVNRGEGKQLVGLLRERVAPAEIPTKLAEIALATKASLLVVPHGEPIVSMLRETPDFPKIQLAAPYDSPLVPTDDAERVAPAAAAIRSGRMRFLAGSTWFEDFQAELFAFPDPDEERSCVEVVALAGRVAA